MNNLPETILQFGAGRFLRAFIDRFVHQANEQGQNVGRIVVVQREADQRSELLNGRPEGYEILVRGYQNNELVQRRERVQSISRVLLANTQWPDVLAFAKSPELRYIVSNATESGYVLDGRDQLDSAPPDSLPGKLTQVLWARFQSGAAPVTLLPCELIECNGDKLSDLVVMQSRAWNLPDAFRVWVKSECTWLNSLVDCIVTMPEPALAKDDPLLICAEPYYLWALESPGTAVPGLLFEHPALRVAEDISSFFLRKVRILNGTHTAMVGKFFGKFETVQKLLDDRAATRWIRDLMYGEIVPTLAHRVDLVPQFADETFERFRNPFTNHKLSDIAKGHAAKVHVRLKPTREEYEHLFGKPPARIVEAMKPLPANQPRETVMQDAHDPYAALRHRDYGLLLSSNVLAALAGEIQFTVVEWEIFQRTNSYVMMAYGGLAQFLPLLLLALPAGQAADRFSRKYMMILGQFVMALGSLGLAFVSINQEPVEWMFVCLALAGVARAIGMPARASLIPLVVPLEAVGNAVTWSSSGWQIAAVAGPAIGGLMARAPAAAYFGTVGGLIVCMSLASLMRPRVSLPSTEPRTLGTLLAGLRFVCGTELLFAAITLDLFAVLLGGCTALLPPYCKEILFVGETGFGVLRAAPAIGAFVMGILIAHRPPMQRPGKALLWSVAGFGMATIGFGLSDDVYFSFAMLFLLGAFDNISVVIRGTLMQMLTPDDMRGRVGAVNSVFISSTNQLGAFESGIAAKFLTLVGAVVIGGYGTLLVVGFAALYWPKLRRLEPLHTLQAKR